ncbi:MAG: hypothetical protein EXR54_00745 [Dehalococcoidia bacterium]|nr:hypothetical protein [Dehalococcoidia bacterium]MSQ16088.1 hypothetical protein [Dehalococcoidia bacterium]
MTNQERKLFLSLAGEFFVAAELQRRGASAAVTYGNAKQADVVVLSASRVSAVVLEVNSTTAKKWVVGNRIPEPSDQLWVFVKIPEDKKESPRYFILTSRELHGILMPYHLKYQCKYRQKYGHESTATAVVSLPLKDASSHEARWDKVLARVPKS